VECLRLRGTLRTDCNVRLLVDIIRESTVGRRGYTDGTQILAVLKPSTSRRGVVGRGHGHVVFEAVVPVPT